MSWDVLLNFLGHGGFKLAIIAVAFVGHLMKKRREQAAKERPPMPGLPNQMGAAMKTQTPRHTSTGAQGAPADLGSPWSSSGDPFDGAKS